MAAQIEPRRDCLVRDQDGDIWQWNANEWVCQSNPGEGSWDDLEFFGPFQIFAPQTDDGAAVAAQSMGGSLPPAVPSSPQCACMVLSEDGHCTRCGKRWFGSGPAVIGGQPGPDPRRFELYRHTDISQVSGTGVVAEGCEFTDGSVALRWRGDHPATAVWPSVADLLAVHGHQGATEIRWLDDEPIDLWPAEGGETDGN